MTNKKLSIRLLCVVLTLCMLVGLMPLSVFAADATQEKTTKQVNTTENLSVLESIGAGPAVRDEYFGKRDGLSNYKNNIPLSFCHRGSFRSSSENSYLSVYDSILLGMDGLEIDLMMTKDGVVILSHDNNLNRVTDLGSTSVSSLNWADIKDHPLEVGNGSGDRQYYVLAASEAALLNTMSNYKSHYGEAATAGGYHYVARLDDLLELVKEQGNNTLLTLDKMNNQALFVACYKLLRERGMLNQVMFKMSKSVSEVNTWTAAAATACGITQAEVKNTFMMLYVIGTPVVANLQAHLDNGSYVKAVESTYGADSAAKIEKLFVDEYIPFCKANNVDLYPSSIGPRWAGGRDDDETTWLHYLKMGVDGIMTDRSEEFAGFMHYYNGAKRTSSDLIQAEHFQDYNDDSAQFYMKEAADVNNNKLVNEMHSGDWLQYNNITFSGSESTIYATARGFNGGGTLKFYVDSISETNLFASVSFGSSDYCVTRSAALKKTVSAGTHKVFVVASGSSGAPLLSFDAFTSARQSDDHYLFFDFTNTSADKTRYAKSIYGGYNFDKEGSGYWSTNATAQGESNNQTNYTINNAAGVATVTVGNDYEGEKVYCGPKFMTTNTYGTFPWGGRNSYAPLKYVPSISDYLVVRFKVDGCKQEGSTLLFMEGWCSSGGTDTIKYEQIKADYTLAEGEYQTVIAPLPDVYKKAELIKSLGLRFTGLLSKDAANLGKVTIDYIYVGPMQSADNVLIDFDKELGSYSDAVYGGFNYDLANRWTYNSSRSTAPTIANGALSFKMLSSCTVTYHRMMLANANMSYTPGDDDYCQIRFKVDNGTVVSGKNASVNVYYSMDLYGTAGYGGSNNDSATYDLTAINNNGYYILSVPMDEAYYRDSGIIRSLCVMFNNVAVSTLATFTIDYIYLGSLDNAPSGKADGDLFFDFENTPRDQGRYDSIKYGFYNFDREQNSYWATNATAQGEDTNQRNFTINNAQGVAVVKVGDDTEGEQKCGPKFMTSNTYGVFPWNGRGAYAPLNYDPSDAEVIQLRFKIDNCVSTGSNSVQMEYHYDDAAGTDAIKYGDVNAAFSFVTGEYQVWTAPLSTTFKSAAAITSLGVRFMNIKSPDSANLGTVTIDYIYVGSEENVPYQDHLYFDFTNTAADRARYGTKTYGYTNFDDPTNWWCYTPRTTAPSIDSAVGTLSFSIKDASTVDYHYVESGSTDNALPLNYVPGENDYCQVRVRVDNAVLKSGSNAKLTLLYAADDDTSDERRIAVNFSKARLGSGYFNINFALPDDFRNAERITAIRLMFGNLISATGKNASFAIDYIYIGSPEGVPMQHSYSKVVTAPTCTAQGYTTYTCKHCYDSYAADYVAAKGHTEVIDKAVAATCTTAGKTEGKHCSVCKAVLVAQNTVAATGHSYDDGVTVERPDCINDGEKLYTCTVCGATKIEPLDKTGHNLVFQFPYPARCMESGMREHYECSDCGETFADASGDDPRPKEYFVIAPTGHKYESVVTAPTCTEEGYTTYKCRICGDTYLADRTAAKGHSEVIDKAVASRRPSGLRKTT